MRHIPLAILLIAVMLLSGVPGISSARTPVGVPAAGANTGEARLLIVGDLTMGRYVNISLLRNGFDSPFKNITPYISSADLAIGNLEGPIVPTNIIRIPPAAPNLLNLTGDQRAAPALARAGFDLLSLANNHAYDAKVQGIAYTSAALRRAGVTPFGLDSGAGQQPVIKESQGLKLAFLGYTNILNIPGSTGVGYVNASIPATTARTIAEIKAAKEKADLVIVMMHWGAEYALQPSTDQRALAKMLVDAGADLVVGAHPHVAQGMELQARGGRSVPVIYSLGNALFDQQGGQDTRQGLSLQCVVDKDGVKSARLVPLEITSGSHGYIINVNDNAAGQYVLQRASQSTIDPDLRWNALWDASQPAPGLALAYRRSPGSNPSSAEDLGIGSPTRVELSYGRLTVSTYSVSTGAANQSTRPQWHTIWASDPDWRVTGYSVGDANGDGKPDLTYTLWKRQQTWERPPGGGLQVNPDGGDMLPHIFINDWARGALNPLWHGSPRPMPVLAAVAAPIGPSGRPLLAVLESSDPSVERAPGRLAFWSWSGGFGYELSSTLSGSYSEMWSDGRQLIFR